MSTQTFDLHLRFTVSLDVGEATITAVAAVVEPAETPTTPTVETPATGGGPAKSTRTKKDKDKPATTPTLTVVPPVTDPPAADPKAAGEKAGQGEQQTLTGGNVAAEDSSAGGPP